MATNSTTTTTTITTTTASTAPISSSHFAAALADLSLPTLHLKLLEIRNSISHLRSSNVQLLPFAMGTETAVGGILGEPDRDCAEAIRENEAVIDRMRERIDLIRAEVEGRGSSWREFEEDTDTAPAAAVTKVVDEDDADTANGVGVGAGTGPSGANGSLANGLQTARDEEARIADGGRANPTATSSGLHSAWTDGTFQTGVIRNGALQYDDAPGQSLGVNSAAAPSNAASSTSVSLTSAQGTGGRLTDDQLRRAMEDRMRELDATDEDDQGLHL